MQQAPIVQDGGHGVHSSIAKVQEIVDSLQRCKHPRARGEQLLGGLLELEYGCTSICRQVVSSAVQDKSMITSKWPSGGLPGCTGYTASLAVARLIAIASRAPTCDIQSTVQVYRAGKNARSVWQLRMCKQGRKERKECLVAMQCTADDDVDDDAGDDADDDDDGDADADGDGVCR